MKLIDKEIRSKQVLSIFIYGVIQMLSLISPYLMGVIIDDFIPNRETTKIIFGIVLFVAIPFLSVSLQTLYNYITIKYVRKKGNEYGLKIMENLIYQDMSFYDKENSLELLSYSSKEAVGYINFHVIEMSQYYVGILLAVVTFVLLVKIHPVLGLMQLLYIPMVSYPVKEIGKRVEKAVATVVEKNAEINQIKGDIFKAISFIKLYRLEKKKLEEVAAANSTINGVWGKIASLDLLTSIWANGFVTVLFTGLSFGVGAMLILSESGTLQVGQLVSVITYGALFYSYVNNIMQTGVSRKKQEAEYGKLFSYLEMEDERGRNVGKQLFSFHDAIAFRHCQFAYEEDKPVLKDLSLTFQKGAWTGIVGSSGSGKSTLFDLMMRLYKVDDGMVFLDGTDINNCDPFDIREHMTRITQDVFLFPGTIADNLRLVNPTVTEQDMQRVLDFVSLSEYIAALPHGLHTDVGEAGKLMSGGERQRLSLAMGLLRGKKILLLDEVTSSLDRVTEERLAENFRVLKENGYTIISISHKLEFLKYADVVYQIEDGRAETVQIPA